MKLTLKIAIVLCSASSNIYSQEYALVRENGLFGYINTSGEFAIKPQFKADNFTNERAAASMGEKWGFINAKEEVLGNKWYENAEVFDDIKN